MSVKDMIISVGGTPGAITASLNHYRPNRVIFFCSRRTGEDVEAIKRNLHYTLRDTEKILTEDAESLGECYTALKVQLPKIISNWKIQPANLTVDYTGGTKTMSAALVLVGVEITNQFSYVGGTERTKGGVGVVVDGRERTIMAENPYTQMAVFEMVKIVAFFNTARYKDAMDLCQETLKRLGPDGDIVVRRSIDCLRSYADAFLRWDNFNPNFGLFKKALKENEDLSGLAERPGFKDIFSKAQPLNNHLEGLTAGDENRKNLAFIVDLFANAVRRAEWENKFDDAVARLYSVLERVARFRLLEKYGIDNSKIQDRDICKYLSEQEWARFKEKFHIISTKDKKDEFFVQTGLKTSYFLLAELNDDLGRKAQTQWSEIEERLNLRNKSPLAHGTTPVSEIVYTKFKDFVLDFLKTMNIPIDNLPQFPHLDASLF